MNSGVWSAPFRSREHERYGKAILSFLHDAEYVRQAFDTEMQSFFDLFTRYLAERASSVELYAHFSVLLLASRN
jgi:hypothetical protein